VRLGYDSPHPEATLNAFIALDICYEKIGGRGGKNLQISVSQFSLVLVWQFVSFLVCQFRLCFCLSVHMKFNNLHMHTSHMQKRTRK
jgi:hypothetical protein